MSGPPPELPHPAFHILRGMPDVEEVAAVTAVLAALAEPPRPTPRPCTPVWADPGRHLGVLRPSRPDAWRGSGLPV
ncbi:acyl-CoA carboxylase epsilon subunit [Amycolatopsis marina]|uniref:acyl-CoA carboxylase epsilon subunit n=1 Tax=Amycolatopsis marina TaxID=490629 RepID=UPI0011601B0F|nr:acyl-CoA carboxylase epsilon subunit [Amycolatopsis marina]